MQWVISMNTDLNSNIWKKNVKATYIGTRWKWPVDLYVLLTMQ
jgi:hypothetical protein